MNICYADVLSTKHSSCYPIKDIVLRLGDMSCKEAARVCPRNSFRHMGHFYTIFLNQILHYLSEGGDILKRSIT